jgi:hypothetical protein
VPWLSGILDRCPPQQSEGSSKPVARQLALNLTRKCRAFGAQGRRLLLSRPYGRAYALPAFGPFQRFRLALAYELRFEARKGRQEIGPAAGLNYQLW